MRSWQGWVLGARWRGLEAVGVSPQDTWLGQVAHPLLCPEAPSRIPSSSTMPLGQQGSADPCGGSLHSPF